MVSPLSVEEASKRAGQIKLVLSDCDGVLTDAGVYYSDQGEVMKRFSLRDGMGVELLRKAGIETAIITRENSPAVQKRAEKLKMPFLYLGVQDKRAHLDAIAKETKTNPSQMAYIGDDVNDLEIMEVIREAGLIAAPADATDAVRARVHFKTEKPGGYGAFREFSEWILKLRT